jgi:protein-glutamine gamma-glutamyltransferase
MLNNYFNNKKPRAVPASPAISRQSLAWLFAIQVFVLGPHFFSVPLWILVIWAGVVFWRWRIFQGAWSYPKKLHKTMLVFTCCVGLVVSLGASFSLISMLSLLMLGFILKLLEMKNRTDFVLLVFIAIFIVATQFIFFNNFLAAFYGLFCLTLLFTLLMQAYKNTFEVNAWIELRATFFILLQAIPFMLMLFIAIPRLGSFWAVPAPQQAKTGMSDSMSPGDISELIQSNELAFRVIFEGDIPTNEKLYWRGLVFSYFDGRRWKQNFQQLGLNNVNLASQPIEAWLAEIDYMGEDISYNVIAEPNGQPWLYLLGAPKTWSDNVIITRDVRLQSRNVITQRISYKVTSVLDYHFQADDQDAVEIKQNLQLPEGVNPETRRIAQEWFFETGTTEKLIEKLFGYYNQKFVYTLRPPSLGADSVDEFLWKSKQGFCEHFSSSFVFFMRAAGVPARVVVGYQGGQLNSVENYLSVRQRDAHAWAEVWIKNRGWVLYDPTSAVAPERIQQGIAESLSVADQHFLAQPFGQSFKLLNLMVDQWQALNFQWARWVMNYDPTLRSALLAKLLGNVNPLRVALLILAVGLGSALTILALSLFQHYRMAYGAQSAHQKVYRQFCKKLKPYGFVAKQGETPRDFATRCGNAKPELREKLSVIMCLYERWVYGEDDSAAVKLKYELGSFSS